MYSNGNTMNVLLFDEEEPNDTNRKDVNSIELET